MTIIRGYASCLRLAGLALLALGIATGQAWAVTLDELAAEAKSEGKVVVIGPAHQGVRSILPAAFKKRFGIDMEYMGGRGGAAVARLQAERAAGHYTTDVAFAGIQTLATVMYPQGMLAPVKPLLVVDDVLDGSKWLKGEPWFIDPEKSYALRLFAYVGEMFTINTDHVKRSDFKTAKELLLNPKWKGKIVAHDPRRSGTGSNVATQYYMKLGGEEFLRKFYVGQQPKFSRNERQITDWLLRGTYPIVIGGDFAEVEKMRNEGLPVESIYKLPDLQPMISGGNGNIVLFDKAPHPKAAKLLINWLASKEGLEVYARASKRATTRLDIDEKRFLPVKSIPQKGEEYFDAYDWEFSVKTKAEVRRLLKKMLDK
jgi:ABC-type Fe3+ transport system substrate-binding protein